MWGITMLKHARGSWVWEVQSRVFLNSAEVQRENF